MDRILIEVPPHIVNDEKLEDWLMDNTDLFSGALEIDTSHLDDRATVDDVRITEINVDKQTVVIRYEYDYSVFYGCRDMDGGDTEDDLVIVGNRQGNTITFETFKPRERRSTYDEL